ncbi:hypothetical protein VINI7043_26048 [Vibrio nigripulchritudo ATCC 27043]|nr:hypothetical protein VINI7043_26048 [Vibrio nigripulchritudo ATCC 27043]
MDIEIVVQKKLQRLERHTNGLAFEHSSFTHWVNQDDKHEKALA